MKTAKVSRRSSKLIQCRIAACRESLEGNAWNFYIINDNDFSLDEVILYEIGYEWGDWGDSEVADVHVTGLASGGNALIWKDGGGGAELRMELSLRIKFLGRVAQMQFEFPKLYKKKNLPVVEGLSKPGWQRLVQARV